MNVVRLFHRKFQFENNLNVQRLQVVENAADAEKVGRQLMKTIAKELVIKAQILAAGRREGIFDNGLKSGVHFTSDPVQCAHLVKQMIKQRLITKQTPTEGVEVQKVMVAEALDIVRETYLAIALDSVSGGAVLIGSPMVEKSSHQIIKIDPIVGLKKDQALDMAKKLGFQNRLADQAADQMIKLYRFFVKYDCTQIEINPFGETADQRVVHFGVKLTFDDNAKFRQSTIFNLEDKNEIDVTRSGLNYLRLHGDIGCLVNGAGLAMATMDLIQFYGGRAANFLHIEDNIKEQDVLHALKLLSRDEKVKAIFINIFSDIVNLATIREACEICSLQVPLVVRLQGSNINEILTHTPFPIIVENDWDKAVKKVVGLVGK